MGTSITKPLDQADSAVTKINVKHIGTDRPKAWLAAGFEDFRRAPVVSFIYGLFWVGLSVAITAGVIKMGLWHWLLPLIAGFMFLGPIAAVGCYGISKAVDDGKTPHLGHALGHWLPHGSQLAMVGVMMMIFFLAWIRLATLLFALFFGLEVPSQEVLYASLLTTPKGLGLVAVGTIIGGLLAFGAFAISAVAIPVVMDRDASFMEGIEASIRCVTTNFLPMLLWGVMLTVSFVIGVMTFYISLTLILPVLGYASWHAYEDLVSFE